MRAITLPVDAHQLEVLALVQGLKRAGGEPVTLRREKAYIAGIARTVWVEVPDEQ